jgi:hypothetical protein
LPDDDFEQNRENLRKRIVYLGRSVAAAGMPLFPRMRQCSIYWSADFSGILNSGRQEVGPKRLVFFEKNGIAVFPSLSKSKKPLKNGLVSVGKSSDS